MASKVSALIEATTIAATDLFYSVVGGASRRVKAENVFATFTGSKHLFSYATLNAAVDAIASAQATLWITSSTTVAASKTVPSNITLKLTGTGVISVNVSQTLTINGPIEAPLRQIFTGSGVVRFGGQVEAAYGRWFGTAEDDSTDDAAALQKAVESFTGSAAGGPRAGVVRVIGPCAIGSTVTSTLSSVIIDGPGWGFTADTRKRGFIRWIGTTAIPMFKFSDCVYAGLRNIRLVGKSTGTKPTAGVEFEQTGGSGVMDQPVLENVWIGPYGAGEADTGIQFDAGVLFSGSVNCDGGVFRNVHVVSCTVGIDNQNPNATVSDWLTLEVKECATGLKTEADTTGRSWLFSLNDVDIDFASANTSVMVDEFVSEGSGRLAVMGFQATELIIRRGSFQCYLANFTPADAGNDRYLIDAANGNGQSFIHIEDFDVTYEGGVTINPTIRQLNTSPGSAFVSSLRCINVGGITIKNLDLGTAAWTNDATRYVEFTRKPKNAGTTPVNSRMYLDWNRAEDNVVQDTRFDVLGKLNVFGGPFYVKPIFTPNGVGVVATGGTGTTYSYKVSALTLTGETLASAAATVSGGATLGPTVYNDVSWHPVLGAYAYKVYGRTGGSELLIATVLAEDLGDTFFGTYRDTGTVTPSGALPTKNTTGRAYFGTPDVAPDDATLSNGQVTFYLDEAGNKLKVRVKYSDGTLKTGELALT